VGTFILVSQRLSIRRALIGSQFVLWMASVFVKVMDMYQYGKSDTELFLVGWRTVSRRVPQWKFQNPSSAYRPQKRRAKYAGGAVGDALCAEVLEVVLHVLVLKGVHCCMPLYVPKAVEVVLEVVNGVRRVLWVLGVLLCLLFYMLYLRALRAVSVGSRALCAGGREGRAACTVGAVYAGGCGG
jgi:hypothetical protein